MLNLYLNRICEMISFRLNRMTLFVRSWYWKLYLLRRGGVLTGDLFVREGAGFSCGQNCKIRIGQGLTLAVGARVFIGSNGSLEIGDGVFIGRNSTVVANEKVTIGDHCQIAHLVTIIDSDHRYDDPSKPSINQGIITQKISIGKDVWIGANAVVLKNVSIGDHSIIGAAAVVTKDVPQNSKAVGNPVQLIPRS